MTQDTPREPGSFLLRCARLVTGRDAAAPADTLWIVNGRIAAAGPWAELSEAAGALPVVEVPGGIATAGFVDSHTHWSAWALALRRVDVNTASMGEALERIRRAARDPGDWILGHGWDSHLWGETPTAAALDRVVPDRPVLMESRDIHAAWLNSAALRRCGIGPSSPDPEGGRILREMESGEPAGVLLEKAREIALRHIPDPSADDLLEAVNAAQEAFHARGITGIHDVEPEGYGRMLALRRNGRLRLRVLQHLPPSSIGEAERMGLRSGTGDAWFKTGGVKVFLDGSLGSRTAWMRAPYAHTESDRGIEVLSETDFRAITQSAARAGLAMTVHAIGDAAVERAVRVLGRAPRQALPHRIEHVQLCPPDLIGEMARAGIVASMQTAHIPGDIDAAESAWGERSRHAFPVRSLLDAGVVVALGSDAPVVDPDPRPGLRAAVLRQREDGTPEPGWVPGERIGGEDALSGYTRGPALAAGEAARRGMLRKGADADVTVWSADPRDPAVPGLRCLLTVVDGEVVYDSR